jgi:hypothetical protein
MIAAVAAARRKISGTVRKIPRDGGTRTVAASIERPSRERRNS